MMGSALGIRPIAELDVDISILAMSIQIRDELRRTGERNYLNMICVNAMAF
jgi:hypothetical protein